VKLHRQLFNFLWALIMHYNAVYKKFCSTLGKRHFHFLVWGLAVQCDILLGVEGSTVRRYVYQQVLS